MDMEQNDLSGVSLTLTSAYLHRRVGLSQLTMRKEPFVILTSRGDHRIDGIFLATSQNEIHKLMEIPVITLSNPINLGLTSVHLNLLSVSSSH